MTPRTATPPVHELIQALLSHGLDVHTYRGPDATYVHVNPPGSPSAGARIHLRPHGGHACFVSEWGTPLGCRLGDVAQRVVWWFGRSRARP